MDFKKETHNASVNDNTSSVKDKKAKYEDSRKKILRDNFAKAISEMKKLRNVNRNSTSSLNIYSREDIQNYVKSPLSNEANLRNVSWYLYYRSNVYFRLVNWYATMWDLNSRNVVPLSTFNISGNNDNDNILKSYEETLNQLETYNMQDNSYEILLRSYIEDVVFAIFYRDETGSFFYVLDPSECKIDGRYFTKDFSYSVDMSKWRTDARQEIIEFLGEPLQSMYKEYERTGEKYIHMPDEYCACIKFRSAEIDRVIPPFAGLFQEIAHLLELEDIQAIADEQSIYKLLVLKMKILSGANIANDFEVDPDLMNEYLDIFIDSALPDYVTAAMIPGDGIEAFDFSTTATDKDISRVDEATNTLLSTAGGGAVINTRNINNTAAFNAWLKSETEFAISSLMPQIQGITNRMLTYDVSNPCNVVYFPLSVYTRDDYKKSLLESCQYSFNNKIAYNTLNGISEKSSLAMAHLEENILGLHDIMKYPLSSSYTQSSDSVGSPKKEDDEIEDSTERSRNNPS